MGRGCTVKKTPESLYGEVFRFGFSGNGFFFFCSAKIKLSGFSGAISNQYNY
jgi:hypothetical protein